MITFSFEQAEIHRQGQIVIPGLDWELTAGQHWLVTGPVGSGKTTLAETLSGKHRIASGHLHFFHNGSLIPDSEARRKIAYLSFHPDSLGFRYGDFYYQQRYQATESEQGPTVQEYLPAQAGLIDLQLCRTLQITELLARRMIQLSNGQTRRVRLARTLLMQPEILILEEVFTGIDQSSLRIIENVLSERAAAGVTIILIGEPLVLPAFLTHVLCLSPQGHHQASAIDDRQYAAVEPSSTTAHLSIPDFYRKTPTGDPHWQFKTAVHLAGAAVSYGGVPVLTDIHWQIHKGEKWLLSGPNGSGKTSLISLIFADNPQAYAQPVTLFDRPRGSGESIWDIKRKIGFISPELQTYLRTGRTALEVAAAGFTNTLLLNRRLTTEERDRLYELFDYFGVRKLSKRPFTQISGGEQRLVLLIRAVVNNAPLLILDEPFHGLTGSLYTRCLQFLSAYCHADRSLIYISHLPVDLPGFITHQFKLAEGEGKVHPL